MTSPTIFLNGKYLSQGLTGVQRVASNLVLALDEELAAAGPVAASATRWVLLHPRQVQAPPLKRIETRPLGPASLPGHTWEQTLLPWAAREGLLLSLAGSAPWLARRQIAMLHDAAVFDHPQAYTRSFVSWYRALFKHLSIGAELLLTPSAFSAGRLEHWLAPQRLALLPASGDHILRVDADYAVIDKLGLRQRPFLLVVASANPTKNLAMLHGAYAQWSGRHKVALVQVGGSNRRVFRDSPASLESGACIETGRLSDSELKALYEGALALAIPSIYEGFGIPALEAMHCGCPVIAAQTASLPEVCGTAAHYVDPSQPVSLIAAWDRLTDDDVYRQQLRAAGRERAGQFNWQGSARRLLQLLGQNASSPPPSPP